MTRMITWGNTMEKNLCVLNVHHIGIQKCYNLIFIPHQDTDTMRHYIMQPFYNKVFGIILFYTHAQFSKFIILKVILIFFSQSLFIELILPFFIGSNFVSILS